MAMLQRSLSFFQRFLLACRKPDKLQQFIVFLSRNWRLRIVSVLLAIGVWVYVQLATNMVTVTLTVPLAAVKVKENCQAQVSTTNGVPIESFRIQMLCSPQDRDKFRDNDFAVEIDLGSQGQTSFGSYELRPAEHAKYIGPQRYAQLAKIQQIEPSTVSIVVEPTYMKLVTVKPDLAGEPAEGYELSGVIASPSAVMIKGPERLVKTMDTVGTERIDIGGLNKPFRKSVRIVVTNVAATVVDKAPVDVMIGVNTKPIQRTFANIEVLPLGKAARGRTPWFAPAVVTVVVQGMREFIDTTDPRAVKVFVDVRDLTASGFSMPIQPLAPANCNVISVMPETVTVNLVEEP